MGPAIGKSQLKGVRSGLDHMLHSEFADYTELVLKTKISYVEESRRRSFVLSVSVVRNQLNRILAVET